MATHWGPGVPPTGLHCVLSSLVPWSDESLMVLGGGNGGWMAGILAAKLAAPGSGRAFQKAHWHHRHGRWSVFPFPEAPEIPSREGGLKLFTPDP